MVGSDWAGVGGTSEGITARLSNQVDQLERTSEEMVGSLGCCWLVLRFGPDHSLQPHTKTDRARTVLSISSWAARGVPVCQWVSHADSVGLWKFYQSWMRGTGLTGLRGWSYIASHVREPPLVRPGPTTIAVSASEEERDKFNLCGLGRHLDSYEAS